MGINYFCRQSLDIVLKMVKYNMKVIFGNRFIWFVLAAIAFTFLSPLPTFTITTQLMTVYIRDSDYAEYCSHLTR